MQALQNYIGGKFYPPQEGNFLDNIEPATAQVYAQIPASTQKDVALAVEAASQAFPAWSSDAKQRSHYLAQIAEGIRGKLDLLAQAESKDNGKPVSLAKTVDIPRAAANFEFYASAITHFGSEAYPTDNQAINYVLREPIGVVGCISPWNLPLYLFTWKIAPALAAGNCVIAKPSEITPMTAFMLAQICDEVGLPAGVLNILHGYGHQIGQAIVEHPRISAISFTGGTQTGKHIASVAAPMFKKLSLELGGKNPNIIFEDCDFEKAVKTSVRAAFSNQGQICLCGSRIFVQASLYEKFKTAFLDEVAKLKVGDPQDPASKLGATVSKAHQEKVLAYIQLAKEEGGTILAGGHALQLEGRCKDGFFVAPTVIEGLSYDCRTNQEEIFGSVVTLMPFETQEEVLTYANSTPYGLAATVWTQDLQKAHRFAQQLKSGIVWINCWMLRDLRTPFGGVKQSGVGREGGFEAMRFFTEPKNVCVAF